MIFDINDHPATEEEHWVGASDGLNGLQVAAIATGCIAAGPAVVAGLMVVPELVIPSGLTAAGLGYAGHREANGQHWNIFHKDDTDKK